MLNVNLIFRKQNMVKDEGSPDKVYIGESNYQEENKMKPSDSNPFGGIINNGGIVTQGQTGGVNTVNLGPRYAEIGAETIAQIKSQIPQGAEVSVLTAIQDGPTSQAANNPLVSGPPSS